MKPQKIRSIAVRREKAHAGPPVAFLNVRLSKAELAPFERLDGVRVFVLAAGDLFSMIGCFDFHSPTVVAQEIPWKGAQR